MSWIAALVLLQVVNMELPTVDKNPYTSPADIEWGKKLFGGRCAGCHGPEGEGGKGANLRIPVLPRASDDRSLYRVVRYGLPETEMPSTFLIPKEVWQVAAYVRTLGAIQPETSTGNAARGKAVFQKQGCLQCHTVGSQGGLMGPPLTDIGARRGLAHLRKKLLEPESDIPEQYRVVDLKTKSGARMSGIRMNEDTWSIQVRDMSNRLHSYWKDELADLKVERKTLMPSFRSRVGGQDLEDLIAYLSGLRGQE